MLRAMWSSVAAVAAFGAIGCVARYLLSLGMVRWLGEAFPWGTMAANVIGSFLLGAIMELWGTRRMFGVEGRVALGTGLMGGFTTYSSFNYETIRLFEQGATLRAGAYVGATVFVCLVAGALGVLAARAIKGAS
jgi:fluoride exporter